MIRAFAALTVVAALMLMPVFRLASAEGDPARLTVETASGKHAFAVEVATTAAQQAQGLMYRRDLAPNAGMLFVYTPPAPVTMWMKNTYIPLDMLFIGADGRILQVVERAVPLSKELIGSDKAVRAVLELNGGTTDRLGIREGDRVVHPAFQ